MNIDTRTKISELTKKVMDKESELLEIYCAAFLKEVGSDKAKEYQLVRRMSYNGGVTWKFEKIYDDQN